MSAYGCCGSYNEHSPNCVTVKYQATLKELELLRQCFDHNIKNNVRLSIQLDDAWQEIKDLKLIASLCSGSCRGGTVSLGESDAKDV